MVIIFCFLIYINSRVANRTFRIIGGHWWSVLLLSCGHFCDQLIVWLYSRKYCFPIYRRKARRKPNKVVQNSWHDISVFEGGCDIHIVAQWTESVVYGEVNIVSRYETSLWTRCSSTSFPFYVQTVAANKHCCKVYNCSNELPGRFLWLFWPQVTSFTCIPCCYRKWYQFLETTLADFFFFCFYNKRTMFQPQMPIERFQRPASLRLFGWTNPRYSRQN